MFAGEIQELTMSLDALNDFSEYIEPLVWEKVKKEFKNEAAQMEALSVAFEKLENLSENATTEEVEQVKIEVKDFFLGDIEITREEEEWIISTSGEDTEKFNNAATNMDILYKQVELMYKSILVNLISNIECFLGDVLRKYFTVYKGEVAGKLLEKKDKIYTIHELEEFDTIEEAKEYIVDKKIENLIRSSFEEWINFLKGKMELSMGYMTSDKESLIEIFQRRNLFIHNKGIINRIYIANVKKEYQYEGEIGEKIFLSREYLENAINLLEKNFVLLALELWKKREPADKGRGTFATKLAEKYMKQEKWSLVESMTTFIIKDAVVPDILVKEAKINFWLAQKRLEKMDKKEVGEYDFSGSTMDYRICQFALLEEYDLAMELVDRALETEQITEKNLFEWPVLNELRETDSFKELIQKRGIIKPTENQLIYPQIEEIDEAEYS